MINRVFELVNREDLQSLIDAARPEGRQIEYKSALPGNSDADKKEFLADVTSFSNTAGGDLLIGVDERREDGRPTGIASAFVPLAAVVADAEIRRLEAMLRDGVAPRLVGVRIRAVPVADGVVLLLRIPKSWSGLHQVTYQNHARFYARNNAGKYQMDVHEIARAFRSSADVAERVRHMHRERVGLIIRGDGQLRLRDGGMVVIHLVPIPVFTGVAAVNFERVAQQETQLRPLYTGHGYGGRFNIDGYLVYGPRPEGGLPLGYLQVFRNGVVETVTASLVDRGNGFLPILTVEEEIIGAVDRYLSACRELDLGLPVSICISLSGVNGMEIPLGPRALPTMDDATPIDREVLHLPDVIAEEHGLRTDRLLKPVFDALWQAGGFARSRNYNDAGDWAPRRR